ncbi:MAG: tyrosine-type recombinase/integrase [Salinibacter sp.]|uniref:tyrosine-type recombinase/integrase n=1 Tax=Salinibacter sp. TaxID=2065818 RepID=UPI0035D43AFD
MASIYERSNGTFYANFYTDGQRARFSLKTKDKREALRKLAELEEAHESGAFDPFEDDPFDYDDSNEDLTLSRAFEKYAEEKKREGMKGSSLRSYRCTWEALMEQVGEGARLDDMTVGQINDVIHDPSVAKSTRHKRYRHAKAILNHLGCTSVLDAVTEPQREDSLPTPVRKDDLSALTTALKEDYRAKRRDNRVQPGQMIWAIPVFRFVFYTGLRASEVAALRWEDIDTDAGVIRLRRQKNGTQNATVPLVSRAEEILKHAPRPREPGMYVWRSPTGPKFERSEEKFADLVSERFRKAREKCDDVPDDRVFHDLRSGFATHLASNGLGAHEVRSAMRHADVSTSMKYVRVANADLRQSMEAAFA